MTRDMTLGLTDLLPDSNRSLAFNIAGVIKKMKLTPYSTDPADYVLLPGNTYLVERGMCLSHISM